MNQRTIKLGETWGKNQLGDRMPGRGPVRIYIDDSLGEAFVEPPVVRALRGKELWFEMRGNGTATFLFPPDVFVENAEGQAPVVSLKVGPGETHVLRVAEEAPKTEKDTMYAYTVEVAGELKVMKAIGGSPPGMVLDDPDGGDPRRLEGKDAARSVPGPEALTYEMPVRVPYHLAGPLRRADKE